MFKSFTALLLFLFTSFSAHASGGAAPAGAAKSWLDNPIAWIVLAIFCISYIAVIFEEQLHLAKSKPVLVAAGFCWMLTASIFVAAGPEYTDIAERAVKHYVLEYGELFLFLLAAMTFINTLEERGLFDALRGWIVKRKMSRRQVFWMTGIIAFCLSPIADNLTTALVMGAVLLSVARSEKDFVGIGCLNVVVAANAGGAFSPFGDITTLMVYQKGIISFTQFFPLIIPSLVTWLVPAVALSFMVKKGVPGGEDNDQEVVLKRGAFFVAGLFLCTIAMAVIGHSVLHLPPVMGMMFGLGLLKMFGYYLHQTEKRDVDHDGEAFDIFERIKDAEWDTLLFFYGVILCVGALGTLGFLPTIAAKAYGPGVDPTYANVAVAFLSAIVDNIPVMFAVLEMRPDMSQGQWLLVTLTAGVGGSMLAIGSAAGVALLGSARGVYTFFSHLKYSPLVLLGVIVGVACHLWLNADLMNVPISH